MQKLHLMMQTTQYLQILSIIILMTSIYQLPTKSSLTAPTLILRCYKKI